MEFSRTPAAECFCHSLVGVAMATLVLRCLLPLASACIRQSELPWLIVMVMFRVLSVRVMVTAVLYTCLYRQCIKIVMQ